MTKFRLIIHGINMPEYKGPAASETRFKKIALSKIPPVLIFERLNNSVEFKDSMYVFADKIEEYENNAKSNKQFTKFLKEHFGNMERTTYIIEE